MNKRQKEETFITGLKLELKNGFLVMTAQEGHYGTDEEVVVFGCIRYVAGGILRMVTCMALASRWPSFLQFFMLIKFNIGLSLVLRLYFLL